MRVFGSYAIAYTLAGKAVYWDANGLEQSLVPGDLVLVFPELAHMYGPRAGESWSEFYLVFEGPVFDWWRKTGFLDSNRPIHHIEPVDYWLRKFESVLGRGRKVGLGPSVLEVCRLQQVLAEALTAEEAGLVSPQDANWAQRVCEMLEGDLDRRMSMPGVARRLKMSYENFRKRFTRIVGVSPARYRDSRVIDRACELMQQGGLRNKEIADRLGFCDEFHFSLRFKQITGRSPREFRRRIPGREGRDQYAMAKVNR